MKFVIRKRQGKYRVLLIAANGEKIAWTETYSSRANALHAVELIKSASDAPVEEK